MAFREIKKRYPDMKVPVKSIIKKRDEYKERARVLAAKLPEYKKAASQA